MALVYFAAGDLLRLQAHADGPRRGTALPVAGAPHRHPLELLADQAAPLRDLSPRPAARRLPGAPAAGRPQARGKRGLALIVLGVLIAIGARELAAHDARRAVGKPHEGGAEARAGLPGDRGDRAARVPAQGSRRRRRRISAPTSSR